jgi:hypothetical protein
MVFLIPPRQVSEQVMSTSCKSSALHHSSLALSIDAILCRLNTDIVRNKAQENDYMLYFIA